MTASSASVSVASVPETADHPKRYLQRFLEFLITSSELQEKKGNDDAFYKNIVEIQTLLLLENIDDRALIPALTRLLDDPDVLNAMKLKLNESAGSSAFVDALKMTITDFDGMVGSGTDMSDLVVTFPRIGQVLAYIFANGTNSDSPNPNSFFEQHLSEMREGLMGLSFASIGMGIVQRFYKNWRRKQLTSYDHLLKAERNLNPETEATRQTIAQDINKILQKKMASDYVIARHNHQILFKKNKDKAATDTDSLPKITTKLKLKSKDTKPFVPNFFIRLVNKIRNSRFGTWLANSWAFTILTMMTFWVGWYPLMIAVGIVAAAASPFYAAISLIPPATFVVFKGLSFAAKWAYKKWFKKKEDQDEATKAKLAEEKIIEDEMLARELAQHYIISKEHALNRETLADVMNESEEALQLSWKIKKAKHHQRWLQTFLDEGKGKEKIGEEIKHKRVLKLNKTKVGSYLLGTQEAKERTRVAMVKDFLDGIVLSLFILWLASTIVLAPVAIAILPAAVGAFLGTSSGWIGGVLIGAIAGGIMGAITGVNGYARAQEKHAAYQKRVLEKLSEPYMALDRNTHLLASVGKPDYAMTKLEAFEDLYKRVEKQKASIADSLQKLKTLGGDAWLTPQEQAILKRAQEVDVYNDYYFEKQRPNPTFTSRGIKAAAHTLEFFGGSQSGIFLTRFFLLGALGLAGALALTGYGLPIVLGVALSAGLVYGSIRLANYVMERRQVHKNFFMETFDARLHYLRSKNGELSTTKKWLEKKIEQAEQVVEEKPLPQKRMFGIFAHYSKKVVPVSDASLHHSISAPIRMKE